MKFANIRVNAAETENAVGGIETLLIKVKDHKTGEIKEVDTAEYLTNMSNYETIVENV